MELKEFEQVSLCKTWGDGSELLSHVWAWSHTADLIHNICARCSGKSWM